MAHGVRPLAGFLTQLIACRDHAPAYRARRQAEPEAATAAYGARVSDLGGTLLDRQF
jgi:hypothetical protein